MQSTLIKQDVELISNAVKMITGYGIDNLKGLVRTPGRMMPAKSAICHYLRQSGHDLDTISSVFEDQRTSPYYLFRYHENMMFADKLYKRYITDIDAIIKQTENERTN